MFRSQLKAKRGVHRVSRKKTPSAAMLDPMELLLRLGGADVDESDMSDTALLKVATAALKRLDLDGDGRVSWCVIACCHRFLLVSLVTRM